MGNEVCRKEVSKCGKEGNLDIHLETLLFIVPMHNTSVQVLLRVVCLSILSLVRSYLDLRAS